MSRSVTRVALIAAGPLVAVATISILGSHSGRPVAIAPATGSPLASLQSLHSGAGDFGRFPTIPPPTPRPATAAAPAAAPVGARPASVHPPVRPRQSPPSGSA